MKRCGAICIGVWVACLIHALPLQAHVGSPNVFFEGMAGPYPVRIVVRPPGVIPGLADISVRVNTNWVRSVTVLPIRWNSGREGAPRPDEAKPVRGETNLFSAGLWFMKHGAQSVEVEVIGAAGSGKVIVPVNAVATRVLGMQRNLGWVLKILGSLLFVLAVSIVGTAVRESVLPAGEVPARKRRWLARATTVISALALGGLIAFGKNWWDAEAADYRNKRLYQPLDAKAELFVEDGRRTLQLRRTSVPPGGTGPFVPDHGKLMHLFLVRVPDMNAFAHLHPVKMDWRTFEMPLPELPAGTYRVYGDVTYESGFADTWTASVTLPEPAAGNALTMNDPDDSWTVTHAAGPLERRSPIGVGLLMEWIPGEVLTEERDTTLRFVVRETSGDLVTPEPYMGMAAHLILQREDGSVFTHLHPSGSFSMVAQQLFELRAEGKAPLAVASSKEDPICKLPPLDISWARANADRTISFPYAFPRAGRYRLWVQTRVRGEVRTGVFDAEVGAAPKRRTGWFVQR